MVSFSSTAPYLFDTVASYSCVNGFGLSGGGPTRTCGGDGSTTTGMWSGSIPTCEGVSNNFFSFHPNNYMPFSCYQVCDLNFFF